MREDIVNSEGLWQILGKYGFLGLPSGEGFSFVRAKDEKLSHTSLTQLRKRVSGLGLTELQVPGFI